MIKWEPSGRPMAAKRKIPKKCALVRGEPVVRGVLDATIAELAAVGYGALRIEDVATRAGVNKTTIYRRWPTKQDLVRAALESVTVEQVVAPDTGSLRGDMLEIGRHMAEVMSSPGGRSLRLMLMTEERNPDFMAIASSLRDGFEAAPRPVVEAARARGELAQGIDTVLLFSVLAGALQHRMFLEREEIEDGYLARLVDLILAGALTPEKRKQEG